MKRKTIQLAKKTLVVSLPNKWVKKRNIKKGQDISIREQGNALVLSSDTVLTSGASIEIKQEKVGKLIHRYITKAYEKGVDEIKINFTNPDMLGPLKKSLQRLIGFELIKQGRKSCIIQDISGQDYSAFDTSLNRLFLTMNNIMEDGIDALKHKNDKLIEHLMSRDEDVNKFSHFCLRILSKKGRPNPHQLMLYAHIIHTIELVGDEFKGLLQEVVDKRLNLGKEELKALEDIQFLL